MLWEYEFNYNALCKDLSKSINSMAEYYEDFLTFKELDAEMNAYYVFKNIQNKYNEYIDYTKKLSKIRKDKFYKIVFSATEKSFTNDKEIDDMLKTLYNFDKSFDNNYMRAGYKYSDDVMYKILDALKERVEKLSPVKDYDYTGDNKRYNWWLIREYIHHKFSRRLYKEETNWEVKNKLGDIVRYFLEEIRNLEIEHNKNNSTKEYRHLYDKVREDMSIFYRWY